MSELELSTSYINQWNEIKHDSVFIEEKLDVTNGIFNQYLVSSNEEFITQNQNRENLLKLVEEYKELKKKIQEDIESSQNDNENMKSKNKSLKEQETELLTQRIRNSDEEYRKFEQKISNNIKAKDSTLKFKTETSRNKKITFECENIVENYKMLAKVDLNQSHLINSLSHSTYDNSFDSRILLNKYHAYEILTGINVINRLPFENREMFEQLNETQPWYDILFTNLPDDCLDFDSNMSTYSTGLKKSLETLSSQMIEFYKSIFRKRKIATCELSKKINNSVFMNNLEDFSIIQSNKLSLICMAITEQEINYSMKEFAIEWVKGSRVLNILINSSSSKMATIILPQFYPLSGTNKIKLIKLNGYEDYEVKKFRIEENFDSLTAWITMFTEMYNTNTIV